MFYLDASVIVGVVTEEKHRRTVTAWIRSHENSLVIISWTLTEVASALSIKVRTGQITVADKASATRQVERMRNTLLLKATIDEAHFYAARRFADQQETGLRGGDALHTAIAADHDLTLVTMDKALAAGARLVGLTVVFLPEGLT